MSQGFPAADVVMVTGCYGDVLLLVGVLVVACDGCSVNRLHGFPCLELTWNIVTFLSSKKVNWRLNGKARTFPVSEVDMRIHCNIRVKEPHIKVFCTPNNCIHLHLDLPESSDILRSNTLDSSLMAF